MALLDDVDVLVARLETMGDLERALDMSAYLRDQFEMLGVTTPQRRAAIKETVDTRTPPRRDELLRAIDHLYGLPEREYHYCAVDLLRRWARVLRTDDLGWLGSIVTTHSWWDTVDALASHAIGTVVRSDRVGARPVLDEWADHDDLWLNRTAILHQLLYKTDTDVEQLFDYCDRHASSSEFFHRKAIGWALRQYARTDAAAVLRYVESRRSRLSNLTIREALKHLEHLEH